jgi:adenylylsulfate kinase-like enzyme
VLWLSGAPGAGTFSVAVELAHRVADSFDRVLYLTWLA